MQKLSAHPTIVCMEVCYKFWVIFGYILEEIVFLKGLVTLGEINNLGDLMWFENYNLKGKK